MCVRSREHSVGEADIHTAICELWFAFVKFEVFTAVTMKNGDFWVVTPCDSCRTDVSEEPGASFIRDLHYLLRGLVCFCKI
jgi:hypothetical protein